MRSMIQKIITFFKSIFVGQGDELLGVWLNNADDGSGMHMIWGYGMEFKKGEQGRLFSWGMGENSDEESEEAFEWRRITEHTIQIKTVDKEKWDEIDYEITNFIGAYNAPYFKIVIKGTNEFWQSHEPLYKQK